MPEVGGEARVAVGDEERRQTMEAVDMVQVDVGELLGGDGLVAADEVSLFGEHADEGDDGVVDMVVRRAGRG